MTWVRIDDGCMEHPKLLAAGTGGITLWLAGLCYANRQKARDGFIPAIKVPCLYPMPGAQKAAARLVEVGLWEQAEGGFRIHDYHDYQPDQERAEAVSAARSEAGRRGGLKSGAARKSATDAETTKQTASKPEANEEANRKQPPEAKSNPVPIPIPIPRSEDPPTPLASKTGEGLDFEAVYARYPGPRGRGKAAGLRLAKQNITTPERFADFSDAVDKYAASLTDPEFSFSFRRFVADEWEGYIPSAEERAEQADRVERAKRRAEAARASEESGRSFQ